MPFTLIHIPAPQRRVGATTSPYVSLATAKTQRKTKGNGGTREQKHAKTTPKHTKTALEHTRNTQEHTITPIHIPAPQRRVGPTTSPYASLATSKTQRKANGTGGTREQKHAETTPKHTETTPKHTRNTAGTHRKHTGTHQKHMPFTLTHIPAPH
jgi:hypothetical protein